LRALSLCACCRHYPGAATGGTASLIQPVISAFPERVVGSACASSSSRLARRSLALRPAHSRCHQFVARLPEGFSHFVASMTAPVASGWSGRRVGLAPTGKRRLITAHTQMGHSVLAEADGRKRVVVRCGTHAFATEGALVIFPRQVDPDCRSFIDARVQLHRCIEQLAQTLHDRQADAFTRLLNHLSVVV
jgi:hypothetical protein